MPELRATFAGSAGAWRGAIAAGGRMVWRCQHQHVARELTSPRFEISARACGMAMCDLLNDRDGAFREMIRIVGSRHDISAGDRLYLALIAELEPEASRLRAELVSNA